MTGLCMTSQQNTNKLQRAANVSEVEKSECIRAHQEHELLTSWKGILQKLFDDDKESTKGIGSRWSWKPCPLKCLFTKDNNALLICLRSGSKLTQQPHATVAHLLCGSNPIINKASSAEKVQMLQSVTVCSFLFWASQTWLI